MNQKKETRKKPFVKIAAVAIAAALCLPVGAFGASGAAASEGPGANEPQWADGTIGALVAAGVVADGEFAKNE
jgi:hypothetical protein